MPKFRKKPVVIEAFQMTEEQWSHDKDWPDWLTNSPDGPGTGSLQYWGVDSSITIETLEGSLSVSKDDWIIQGVQGEIYPCKPDIFEATYEPVGKLQPFSRSNADGSQEEGSKAEVSGTHR